MVRIFYNKTSFYYFYNLCRFFKIYIYIYVYLYMAARWIRTTKILTTFQRCLRETTSKQTANRQQTDANRANLGPFRTKNPRYENCSHFWRKIRLGGRTNSIRGSKMSKNIFKVCSHIQKIHRIRIRYSK